MAKVHKERQVIGFLGADSGIGTTHIAVATANYIASVRGESVAVLELGNHPCIETMNKDGQQKESFELEGVTYFPQLISHRLPELLNDCYDYYILDLGSDAEAVWQEFLRCNQSYLVCSLSPWRVNRTIEWCNALSGNMKSIRLSGCLAQSGCYIDKKRIQYRYHVPVRTMPFVQNPFRIAKETFSFFQELL
ncbi:MAG: hypothetical protein PUD20_03300 [bacterium]|nr:hypothetical protein [bacterium]